MFRNLQNFRGRKNIGILVAAPTSVEVAANLRIEFLRLADSASYPQA